MRTLLTRASGYIGLHILRALLADGQRVTAVVRSPERLGPFARAPGVEVVVADLRAVGVLSSVLPGHHACIHTALLWGQVDEEVAALDVTAASRLFDAAGRAGVARIVFLSSAAVHRPFSADMSEADTLSPTDLYGATKAAGELFLRAHCALHGMTGVVLRPGPVVGPPAFPSGAFRSPGRLADMVEAALQGHAIPTGQGVGRQFSPVSSVARAACLAVRQEAPNPTYVCVDRQVMSWERVAQMVVATTGSTGTVSGPSNPASPSVSRFNTQHIESLLGAPVDATEALTQHIRHLAGRGERAH